MTDATEDNRFVIDEDSKKKDVTEEPFDHNSYIATLVKFLKSTDRATNSQFSQFVAEVWNRPADSANFYTDAYTLDSGVASKLNPNILMNPSKRIAGTQRLMYAPPQVINSKGFTMEKSGPSSSTTALGIKKMKKQIPVIDDAIYCTTDQPCSTCGGVSLSGNQVLACRRCRDCYHMKCSKPPVSTEEASEPSYKYYCKTCLVSKKVIDSSRSRSPSPAMIDPKRLKIGREKPMKL